MLPCSGFLPTLQLQIKCTGHKQLLKKGLVTASDVGFIGTKHIKRDGYTRETFTSIKILFVTTGWKENPCIFSIPSKKFNKEGH